MLLDPKIAGISWLLNADAIFSSKGGLGRLHHSLQTIRLNSWDSLGHYIIHTKQCNGYSKKKTLRKNFEKLVQRFDNPDANSHCYSDHVTS